MEPANIRQVTSAIWEKLIKPTYRALLFDEVSTPLNCCFDPNCVPGILSGTPCILEFSSSLLFTCQFQHLLCLILQALACIAMNPSFHQALSDALIADALMQLLLPSDEWYYTNHSTKYARYVKYHAARILVYMGLFHCLGGRVDLFDTKSK